MALFSACQPLPLRPFRELAFTPVVTPFATPFFSKAALLEMDLTGAFAGVRRLSSAALVIAVNSPGIDKCQYNGERHRTGTFVARFRRQRNHLCLFQTSLLAFF
ncbi:MAG: hypothetical protein AAGA95_00830 [Pseudomonadota bacterium]